MMGTTAVRHLLVASVLLLAGCTGGSTEPAPSPGATTSTSVEQEAAGDGTPGSSSSGPDVPTASATTDATTLPTPTPVELGDLGEAHEGLDLVVDEPDATPADELDDAEVRRGTFQAKPTVPTSYMAVDGEAIVAVTDDGSTVTIRVTGWQKEALVVGHLTTGSCEQDGGPMFEFSADGGELPPNRVHVGGTTDARGELTATATVPGSVRDDARSAVLHAEQGPVLACAELE